jgi:hypothetical protein
MTERQRYLFDLQGFVVVFDLQGFVVVKDVLNGAA